MTAAFSTCAGSRSAHWHCSPSPSCVLSTLREVNLWVPQGHIHPREAELKNSSTKTSTKKNCKCFSVKNWPKKGPKWTKYGQSKHNSPSHKNNVKPGKEITYINSDLFLIFACASVFFFYLKFKLFKSTGQFYSPTSQWWMDHKCVSGALELFTRYLQTHRARPCCSRGNEKFGNSSLRRLQHTLPRSNERFKVFLKNLKTTCNFDSLASVTRTLQ